MIYREIFSYPNLDIEIEFGDQFTCISFPSDETSDEYYNESEDIEDPIYLDSECDIEIKFGDLLTHIIVTYEQ